MKATINGMEIEGTPDEIAALIVILRTENKGGSIEVKGPGPMSHDEVFEQVLDKLSAQTKYEINKLSELTAEQHRQNQRYEQSMWMQNDAQPIMGMGDVIGQAKPKRWDVYTRMDGNGDLRMCEADLSYEEARKLCDDNGGWIMFERQPE